MNFPIMKHIVRFVENHRRLSEAFAFFFFLLFTLRAFVSFFSNVETLNTPKEWKFYFSLIGFLLFYSMLVMVSTVLAMRGFKKKDQKGDDTLGHV